MYDKKKPSGLVGLHEKLITKGYVLPFVFNKKLGDKSHTTTRENFSAKNDGKHEIMWKIIDEIFKGETSNFEKKYFAGHGNRLGSGWTNYLMNPRGSGNWRKWEG